MCSFKLRKNVKKRRRHVAKIVLIEHDCALLDTITGKLRRMKFQVEPICAQKPVDFLMEITEAIYGHHRHNPEMQIIFVSDFHLPGIKGTELIEHARAVARYLKIDAIGYGIMTTDHTVNQLPELVAIPVVHKDSGLSNLVVFMERLVAQQAVL
jgi:hypothetical protein